jgi:hypothetical protein
MKYTTAQTRYLRIEFKVKGEWGTLVPRINVENAMAGS